MSQKVVEEKKVTTTTEQPQQQTGLQQAGQQIVNPDGSVTVVHQTSGNVSGNVHLAASNDPEDQMKFEKQQRNVEGRLQGGGGSLQGNL